ncbi:MAG: hypothetical protein R2731_15495 [Nocardioides sp.]
MSTRSSTRSGRDRTPDPGVPVHRASRERGFADVFLYEQEWPRQRVAIKVVRPHVPLTDREKRLFASEADAMARLADHPYIVSVMTAGRTEDGRPYLVMRYCPPRTSGRGSATTRCRWPRR